MRFFKIGDEGPPALVFIAHDGDMLQLWVGPVGLHLALGYFALNYCGKWHDAAVSTLRTEQP